MHVVSSACVIFFLCFADIFFFFFNDTATTEIYTLSLHDALPIYNRDARLRVGWLQSQGLRVRHPARNAGRRRGLRSEEHTSELQSQSNLVCRLLLEKKKKQKHSSVERENDTGRNANQSRLRRHQP